MVRVIVTGAVAIFLSSQSVAIAQMSNHHAGKPDCQEPTLKCATKVTPTFAPDRSLWLAWAAAGKVSVARSLGLGRTFTSPVSVNQQPLELDWGPDARPKIVIDREGTVVVAFAIFKDTAFNGQVLYTRSTDAGRSFAPPRLLTHGPMTMEVESPTRISRRIIPANVAGSGLHLQALAAQSSRSGMCSAVPCVTMR